jgi:asparagine synthase (glutamine-hydrolysing)
MSFASNGVSMPFTGDWPAVKALRDDPYIADDAVIVPGHTGDFISGGHLKYLFDPRFFDLSAGFYAAMIKKHYSLWFDLAADPGVQDVVSRRLLEVVGDFPSAGDQHLSRNYEYWEWQERQSKFIINSVRSYESFGFSWRIPLWSREIMDFWSRVPIALKMDKCLYRAYLSSHDPNGLFQHDAPTAVWDGRLQEPNITFLSRVKGLISNFDLGSKLLGEKAKFQSRVKGYRHDPLGLASHYSFPGFLFRDSAKRNVISLMTRDFVRSEYGVRRSSVRALAKSEQSGQFSR